MTTHRRHESLVIRFIEAIIQKKVKCETAFEPIKGRTDIHFLYDRASPFFGELSTIFLGHTLWLEHYSSPPTMEALFGTRGKMLQIANHMDGSWDKVHFLVVVCGESTRLSRGWPTMKPTQWCGISRCQIDVVDSWWIDTTAVDPEQFPLGVLLGREEDFDAERVANVWLHGHTDTEAIKRAWEVYNMEITKKVLEQNIHETIKQALQEGEAHGRELGEAHGRELGEADGLRRGLVCLLEFRFNGSHPWADALAEVADLAVLSSLHAVAVEESDPHKMWAQVVARQA